MTLISVVLVVFLVAILVAALLLLLLMRRRRAPPVTAPPVEAPPARPSLRERLFKTRALMGDYLAELRLRARIDDEVWDDIEEMLLRADVGVATTRRLLDRLRTKAKEGGIADTEGLLASLEADLVEQLGDHDRSLALEPGEANVWLVVGVNGTGKTTTIGKLAHGAVGDGHRVMVAAADTFRAAAAEQLARWAERAGAELVRGQEGADPGSVVYDAMSAASARGADLLIVDTAGRLHTKVNLMEELKKLARIVERTPGAQKEVLLVIDATTGQNGLAQAGRFAEAVGVSGIVLTKLDGTAKGGIVLAIQHDLGIPVKLVGVGESTEDLVEFDPEEFVAALFA